MRLEDKLRELTQSLAHNVEEFQIYPEGNEKPLKGFNQEHDRIRFASSQSNPSSIKKNIKTVNIWRKFE
jgi:hypothetical protein